MEEAILTQYTAFFRNLAPASLMKDENARYTLMRKVAVDPELTQAMGGFAAADQAGQALYGTQVLRPRIESRDATTATIIDCQDTSGHGRMVLATGKKVTVGRADDLAKVTMTLGSDGIWRVATVEYAAAGSCHASA